MSFRICFATGTSASQSEFGEILFLELSPREGLSAHRKVSAATTPLRWVEGGTQVAGVMASKCARGKNKKEAQEAIAECVIVVLTF